MKDNENWDFAVLVRPTDDQVIDVEYIGGTVITKVTPGSADWTRVNRWRYSKDETPALASEAKSWIKFIPGDKQPNPWEFVDVKFLNGNEGTSLNAGTINWETVARYRPNEIQPAPPVMQPLKYSLPDGYEWNNCGNSEYTYQAFTVQGWTTELLVQYGFLIPKNSSIPTKGDAELTSSTGTTIDPNSRYYDAGGIETIDIIKAKLTGEQLKGYLLGNVIKYSSRLNFKGSAVRDAEKLKFYSGWLEKLK